MKRPTYKVSAKASRATLPEWHPSKKQIKVLHNAGFLLKEIRAMDPDVLMNEVQHAIASQNRNFNDEYAHYCMGLGWDFWKD